jgi:hypothetical protein
MSLFDVNPSALRLISLLTGRVTYLGLTQKQLILPLRAFSTLRHYARHAQSPKSSAHSVHEMRRTPILQTLNILSYRSYFVDLKDTLTDHFFRMRTINTASLIAVVVMIGVDWLGARSGPSGLGSDRLDRDMHVIVHGHAHVQTDQIKFSGCICAQNGFADRPKRTAYTLFQRGNSCPTSTSFSWPGFELKT